MVKNILIGWGKKWGILPTSEAEEKLSQLRLQICSSCPEAKVSRVLAVFSYEDAGYEERIFCTVCKCPCAAKTIVVGESCPLKKWL